MRPTWKVLVLVLTLALAAPATVLAQSAGDEQYVDPFEGQGDGNGGGGGGGGGNNGADTGGSDNGTTTTSQTAPTDTAGATESGTTSESAGATLPRTGLDLTPVLITGLFLFGAGLLIRRGTRPTLAPAFGGPPLAGTPPARIAPPAPVAVQRSAIAETAKPPRTGVIGLGLVGLFILGTVLRRRA